MTDIDVRYEGRPMGKAVPLKITRHVHQKAERAAPPPVVPTGIDYLSLVAKKRDAELSGQRIDYAQLAARRVAPETETEGGAAGGETR